MTFFALALDIVDELLGWFSKNDRLGKTHRLLKRKTHTNSMTASSFDPLAILAKVKGLAERDPNSIEGELAVDADCQLF